MRLEQCKMITNVLMLKSKKIAIYDPSDDDEVFCMNTFATEERNQFSSCDQTSTLHTDSVKNLTKLPVSYPLSFELTQRY